MWPESCVVLILLCFSRPGLGIAEHLYYSMRGGLCFLTWRTLLYTASLARGASARVNFADGEKWCGVMQEREKARLAARQHKAALRAAKLAEQRALAGMPVEDEEFEGDGEGNRPRIVSSFPSFFVDNLT